MILIHFLYYSRWIRTTMPEKSGIILCDATHKIYFFETNMSHLIDYDRTWPLLRIGAFAAADALLIYCLSHKLGILSPIPKLPLVKGDPSSKFGWAGSVRFVEALNDAREMKAKPPAIIPLASAQFVLQEFEHLASSSMLFTSLASSTEAAICKQCSPDNIFCGSCSEVQGLSASSVNNIPLQMISPEPPKRRNRVTDRRLQTAHHSNKGGVGSHKKTTVKLDSSTKALMKSKMTGLQAISMHGSILGVVGGFTPYERWWIKHFLILLEERINGQSVSKVKDVNLKSQFKEPLQKVSLIF